MASKKRILAGGLILPPELPKWLKPLSAHIKVKLQARIEADGYGADAEAWVRDMVTTAARSSQGYILRFTKTKSTDQTAGDDGLELFTTPRKEGDTDA